MAWDSSKPPASGYLQSAELRANAAAIELQALGMNLFGDPDFRIWGNRITKTPSWWNRSSTTMSILMVTTIIGKTCAAQTMHSGRTMVKLSHGGATGRLYQNVLSTGDGIFSLNRHLLFTDAGQSASMGAWIYTNSADCKLYINLGTCAVLSSAIPTAVWTWKTMTASISSDAASLGGGVQLDAAGTAYVGCPTFVLGPIPPKNFIPAPVSQGTIAIQLAGNPPATPGTSVVAKQNFRYRHNLPFIVDQVSVQALSLASTTNGWSFSVLKRTCAAWVEMMTTSNRPTIAAGSNNMAGVTWKGSAGTTAYQLRCFTAESSGINNQTISVSVASSVVGAGCKDPIIQIRTQTYQPPLLAWRLPYNFK